MAIFIKKNICFVTYPISIFFKKLNPTQKTCNTFKKAKKKIPIQSQVNDFIAVETFLVIKRTEKKL